MGKDRLHSDGKKLGVNGFGRIGKLTLWHHVGRKYFDQIIVNIGRQPGSCLEDIAHYVERDSTYGWLHGYLHGHRAEPVISDLDEESGSMVIDGVKVGDGAILAAGAVVTQNVADNAIMAGVPARQIGERS